MPRMPGAPLPDGGSPEQVPGPAGATSRRRLLRVRSGLATLARAARSFGSTQAETDGAASAVYERYVSLLPDRGDQTLVILADDAEAPVQKYLGAPNVRRRFVISPQESPGWCLEEQGVEHRLATNLDEVNWHMRFFGPVDVVVDLAARRADEYDKVLRKLFFHLMPAGAYVVGRSRSSDGAVPPSILATVATVGVAGPRLAGHAVPDRAWRVATSSVTVDADHVVVLKRGKHILKTKDRLASRLLPAREPELVMTELTTIPGGVLESRAQTHSHDAAVPIADLEATLDYPVHYLRHYRGEIAMVSNGLLHTGFTALPESFRHHRAFSPTNPRLIDASGDFARTRPKDQPATVMSGTYYHLDSENPGHYGHLMTEVVSRLWGWDQAKREFPDLKAIFRIRKADEREPVLEKRIFGAFGIASEDVRWVREPVWLESVVGATPMWHNQIPHYVHPDLEQIWDRIRDSLLAEGTAPKEGFERSGGRRIFVSREHTTTNRTCRNIREVEAFFAERGFDIVYPANHDLAVQAAIFDRAEVLAGFGGSAMFNIMFSKPLRTVILLNHEAYTARNEHLFTAVLGGVVHYFWSTPDIRHPEGGGWSREAYFSPWAFDFERNRAKLAQVITALG